MTKQESEISALRRQLADTQRQLDHAIADREQAERELAASRELLTAFFEHSPVAIYMKDEQGRYVYTNRALQEAMNRPLEDWVGKTGFDLLPREVAERFEADDRIVMAGDSPRQFDVATPMVGGGTTHWITVKFPYRDAKGQRFLVGLSIDVTQQKIAEEELRNRQGYLQAILDNTGSVIYLKDTAGRYLLANKRWHEVFHLDSKDVIGKTPLEIYSPEIGAKLLANDQTIRETLVCQQFEETQLQDDGLHVYISVKFPIFDNDGNLEAIGGISTDITDRKRAAEALENEREFLRHIIALQDQQRQLITYEIHDGMVQYATGALMQLEAVQATLESPVARKKIGKIVEILRTTVGEGRRVINGIRSPVLDDLGIVAALEQLIRDLPTTEMQIELKADRDFGRCAAVVEEALYRISQEAMTNARKHSGSKRLLVELARKADRVVLTVTDWGVGFERGGGAKGVHGLRGMRERARIAGGHCRIESSPQGGTSVHVDLPFESRFENLAE